MLEFGIWRLTASVVADGTTHVSGPAMRPPSTVAIEDLKLWSPTPGTPIEVVCSLEVRSKLVALN